MSGGTDKSLNAKTGLLLIPWVYELPFGFTCLPESQDQPVISFLRSHFQATKHCDCLNVLGGPNPLLCQQFTENDSVQFRGNVKPYGIRLFSFFSFLVSVYSDLFPSFSELDPSDLTNDIYKRMLLTSFKSMLCIHL